MAMAASSIVKHFDVFEYICLREIACSLELPSDARFFQVAEERFSNGIVPAVFTAAHARVELVCSAEAEPVVAAVLRALVRGHDDALLRFPPPHRNEQSIQDKSTSKCRLHGPSDDHATM